MKEVIDGFYEWADNAFNSVFKVDSSTDTKLGHYKMVITDRQCPFLTTRWDVATLSVDGCLANVSSRKNLSSHYYTTSTFDLQNPNSIQEIQNHIFSVLFDYYRDLYRLAISNTRPHLKPLLRELIEVIIPEYLTINKIERKQRKK